MGYVKEYRMKKGEEKLPTLSLFKKHKWEKSTIDNLCDAAELFNDLFDLGLLCEEYGYVIALNMRNEILGVLEIGHGDDSRTPFPIRPLMTALLLMGANRSIIAHNHVAGDIEPSNADFVLTTQIKMVMQMLGICFVAHLVIGENDYGIVEV